MSIDPFSLILIINEWEELNKDGDTNIYSSVDPLIEMYISQNSVENDKLKESF